MGAAEHERAAVAAYLTGRDEACEQAWEAAFRASLDAGDPAGAARQAFWLGMCLMMRGQAAHAGGWMRRAAAVIDEAGVECAASGYLRVPELLGALGTGDAVTARSLALEAEALGKRYDDPDLLALAVLAHGQALIALGELRAGTARLDDVMLSVESGTVGPITSGIVYCAVILECMALFDLPRAAEWTGALSAWCDAQPGLVPYRGQCLVHRSQVEQAAGDWPRAIATAEAACERLADPPHPALGLAHYQRAELHRLRGDFRAAEEAYRDASRSGHDPMPGLALLELARGDGTSAVAAIGRALDEAVTATARPHLLVAAVEIRCAGGDHDGAEAAAVELSELASRASSRVLEAMAAHARGAVLLDAGEPRAAIGPLRDAATSWQALRMPYEAARTASLLARACAAMGDHRAAALEQANAEDTYARLGATPVATERLPPVGELSGREREVLALVAAGKTNREIAAALVLSQHTVRRHLENIFAKLGVTTRAAATAHAYEHGLL